MRPLASRPSRPSRLAAALAAGGLALGLAACSGMSGSDDSGAGGAAADSSTTSGEVQSAPDGARQDLAAPEQGKAAVDQSGGVTGTGASTTVVAAVTDRKLARRADVAIRVADVAAAATRLRTIAATAGGLVVAEEVSSDADGDVTPKGAPDDGSSPVSRGYGTVTISVPATKLDRTLDEVAKVGTVLSRNTSTDDVTGRYVDTASRVASMKASVERVRALMSRATRLADVVTLEAELSRRQADLEALQQQLAALDDQVALAPITVTLSTRDDVPPVEEDPTGFVAGLAAGWEAFTTSIRLLLTLVGALLPFAVALALVLVPAGMWWRRRRPGTQPLPTTTPAAPTA